MRLLGLTIIVLLTTLNCCPQANSSAANILPDGVLRMLAPEIKEFCEDQFAEESRTGCEKKFAAHLRRRDLTIVPSGQTAILVENSNIGFCGQAGCALYIFMQTDNSAFVQVLGSEGGLGTLERVSVLENVTKGHYDISVTWKDGKTRSVYQWDGAQYSN